MLIRMANHAAQVVTRAGTQVVFAAAAAGDSCDTGDLVALLVDNAAGADITVTVAAQTGEGGLNLEDLVVTVPAGQTRAIGPLITSLFSDPATGKADLTYSATASVTVACLSL